MTDFDFSKWLDENAKRMHTLTANGQDFGIITQGKKALLFIDKGDVITELAEFYDMESAVEFLRFWKKVVETS